MALLTLLGFHWFSSGVGVGSGQDVPYQLRAWTHFAGFLLFHHFYQDAAVLMSIHQIVLDIESLVSELESLQKLESQRWWVGIQFSRFWRYLVRRDEGRPEATATVAAVLRFTSQASETLKKVIY